MKYFNINSAIIHIRLPFRLIYSPGQLFALCFTSENKITGLLLVTYKYRGEIVVKLKENKRKKRSFDFLRCHGFESCREIVFSCCCWWFFSLLLLLFVSFFPRHCLIVLVPRETVLFENVWDIETLFTWSGGPRSSGVGFFCFVSPRAWKQKKPTPLDRGPPLHVNRAWDLKVN